MDTETALKRLNEIQDLAYRYLLTKDLRKEWRVLMEGLRAEGHKVGKKHIGGVCLWVLKDNVTPREENLCCEWICKDLSPSHKHLKGNCTTRSLAYIFTDKTYDELEREQYRRAEMFNRTYFHRHARRNSCGVWDTILTDGGYVKISLGKNIRRDRLAMYLKNIPSPMVSRSSSHVCIIDRGKVVDSWDSRKGRVYEIFVKEEDAQSVLSLVGGRRV